MSRIETPDNRSEAIILYVDLPDERICGCRGWFDSYIQGMSSAIALGLVIGVPIGLIFDNIVAGIAIGLAIGIAISGRA
ncbi:MAG: hypothetical protein AB7E81_07750 [Hyphomicrobiaceae bacterium]